MGLAFVFIQMHAALFYEVLYDHTNNARWEAVYLAEMHRLPAKVLEEFKKGKFVVKRSAANFNQVSPDQAQEWLNATGKKGAGVVGITKRASALCRWALSYNLRSHVAAETALMFNCKMDDSLIRKEGGISRQIHDNNAENALYLTLQRFNAFSSNCFFRTKNCRISRLRTWQLWRSSSRC